MSRRLMYAALAASTAVCSALAVLLFVRGPRAGNTGVAVAPGDLPQLLAPTITRESRGPGGSGTWSSVDHGTAFLLKSPLASLFAVTLSGPPGERILQLVPASAPRSQHRRPDGTFYVSGTPQPIRLYLASGRVLPTQ